MTWPFTFEAPADVPEPKPVDLDRVFKRININSNLEDRMGLMAGGEYVTPLRLRIPDGGMAARERRRARVSSITCRRGFVCSGTNICVCNTEKMTVE